MTDLVEDVQVILQWSIDYLTVVLNALRERIKQNKHRPINRRNFIRWVATFLPFKTKDPRMFIKHQLATGNPKDGVGVPRLPSACSLNSSFTSANVHQWLEENIGEDMVQYRRASVSTDDDVLEDLLLPKTEIGQGLVTSTPNNYVTSADSVSAVSSNQGSIRLMEMEDELANLRRQIAMLVVAQESNSNSKTLTDESPTESHSNVSIAAKIPLPISPQSLSDLVDSGCESESVRGPSPEFASIPPAPAPPPPPPVTKYRPPVPPKPVFKIPSCPEESAFSAVVKDKKVQDNNDLPSRSSAPDLVNVLRDLNSVKLRATNRSPGGTPFRRQPRKPLANDPASIIAQALHKKFAAHRGDSPDSDIENESSFFSDSSPVSVFNIENGKKINRRLSLLQNDEEDDLTPVVSPARPVQT